MQLVSSLSTPQLSNAGDSCHPSSNVFCKGVQMTRIWLIQTILDYLSMHATLFWKNGRKHHSIWTAYIECCPNYPSFQSIWLYFNVCIVCVSCEIQSSCPVWCFHYEASLNHDDVIKWNHIPLNWPFVRGIHRWPVNSPHKGQWRGTMMFSLICTWINGWVNNRKADDLRRHRAHYDVTVMYYQYSLWWHEYVNVNLNMPYHWPRTIQNNPSVHWLVIKTWKCCSHLKRGHSVVICDSSWRFETIRKSSS